MLFVAVLGGFWGFRPWATLPLMGCPPLEEARERSRSIGTGMLAYEGGAVVELYHGCWFVFWRQFAF